MNLQFILEIEKNIEQGNAINSKWYRFFLWHSKLNRYIWIAFIEGIDNDIIKLLLKIYEHVDAELIMGKINIGNIEIKKGVR